MTQVRPPRGSVRVTRHDAVMVLRFLAVNGCGTVADVAVVLTLRALGAPLLLAVAAGFLSSQVCGFALNRRFVFRGGTTSLTSSSLRYAVLVAVNLAVGVGAVTWLVHVGWNYVLTRLLSSSCLVVLNFAVARWWVFVVPARQPDPA